MANRTLSTEDLNKILQLLQTVDPDNVRSALDLLEKTGSDEDVDSILSDEVLRSLVFSGDVEIFARSARLALGVEATWQRFHRSAADAMIEVATWQIVHRPTTDTLVLTETLVKIRKVDQSAFTSITDEAADFLVRTGGSLRLDGLTCLSNAAAESLGESIGDLYLTGLVSLSETAAESLSRHEGPLFLGLTSLSDAAAESLGRLEGPLILTNLPHLSDVAAESLSRHMGEGLVLSGLKSLSDAAAESLGNYRGWLNLDDLTSLSDAAARSFENDHRWVDLEGSDGLSPGLWKGLASLVRDRRKSDTDSVQRSSWAGQFSPQVFEEIARALHQDNPSFVGRSFNGLTNLSDAAAESFSRFRGNSLDLNGLTHLSDAAAESLGGSRAGCLSLNGLTNLSDTAAEGLVTYNGTLYVVLDNLPTSAAEILCQHPSFRDDDENRDEDDDYPMRT